MTREDGIEAINPYVENLLGQRILAGIIDLAVVIGVGVGMFAAFGDVTISEGGFEGSLTGLPLIAYMLLALGYYFALEAWRGQTLGKMALGIKVVATEGELSAGKVALRTLMRYVDGLGFYLVGIIAIGSSRSHQRLGDMLAHTRVERV